jgi:hypothetical protein
MYLHANAKLGLAGRLALVRAIEGGLSLKTAAAVFSVSPATAHRWWHRLPQVVAVPNPPLVVRRAEVAGDGLAVRLVAEVKRVFADSNALDG